MVRRVTCVSVDRVEKYPSGKGMCPSLIGVELEDATKRYNLVGPKLVGIIHKKPKEGGISAVRPELNSTEKNCLRASKTPITTFLIMYLYLYPIQWPCPHVAGLPV